MVDVPRENDFEADMVLYWQGRARSAEQQLRDIGELKRYSMMRSKDTGELVVTSQADGEFIFSDELQAILNRNNDDG